MKKVTLVVLSALFVLPLGAETFAYKQETGSRYRILSVVDEDVYVNRRFSHRAHILNRVAVEVGEVKNGVARHSAVFQTSEQAEGRGRGFQWAEEYTSVFDRDSQGYMTIDASYFMPVVRDVPVFPARDLAEGETWSAEGHEMHDFRKSFGIEKPYCIPFTARYVFVGTRQWKGKSYPAFSVSYRIFHEPDPVPGTVWPRRILGSSDQIVYWDSEMGQATAYEEQFRIILELSSGGIIEYRGSAEAEIIESEIMDKEDAAREIGEAIKDLGLNDASVRIDEGGITISLEDIQFLPDSALLRESEKEKLDKIGVILAKYAGRDILVSGHTALAGTAAGRQQLSQQRAAAVSDYLIGKNYRAPEQVVVRGFGAEKPVAPNNTEAGMRRNRRVEITILEN
ncbi:MAG: OmpA family protein [Treponema sp.]|jgi:outer membrane protein OmpA-like peptidoglycan-associated protein|nr:OmpA family protein [Treponema sp.]